MIFYQYGFFSGFKDIISLISNCLIVKQSGEGDVNQSSKGIEHHTSASPTWLSHFMHYRRLLPTPVTVVVALLFYVHGKHLRSCRDRQLT